MSRHIILDSSPGGLLSKPQTGPNLSAINDWAAECLAAGHTIYLPEIIDDELRRELLRARKTNGIARLDAMKIAFRFIPLDTPTLLRAAEIWAQARQTGQSTAAPQKLDIDVILAAQAESLGLQADFIVATSNVGHLSSFVPADLWENIAP